MSKTIGRRALAQRVFTFVLVVAAAGVAGGIELMSPAEFTNHCVERIRAEVPQAVVAVVQPLRLTIERRGTPDTTLPLEDAYEAYRQAPDKLDEIVKLFAAGVREAAPAEGAIDPSLIVPVVRERTWLKDVGAEGGAGLVFDDLNDELIIVYAEDTPSALSYFSPVELQKAEIDRSGLRQLAADNLLRLLPQIERRGEDGLFQVKAGGDFEASLLAIGTVWRKESFDVKGDFVFAIPAVGTLYLTGSEDKSGIASLRKMGGAVHEQAAQKLSPHLFVLRDGKLSILPE